MSAAPLLIIHGWLHTPQLKHPKARYRVLKGLIGFQSTGEGHQGEGPPEATLNETLEFHPSG